MATFNASFGEKTSLNASMKEKEGLNSTFGPTSIVRTSDYSGLTNKPAIEGNTLIGDKTFVELGLAEITPQEIDEIMFGEE